MKSLLLPSFVTGVLCTCLYGVGVAIFKGYPDITDRNIAIGVLVGSTFVSNLFFNYLKNKK